MSGQTFVRARRALVFRVSARCVSARSIIALCLTVSCVTALCASHVRAQAAVSVAINAEVEPNNSKSTAAFVPCMSAGDIIVGTSTGTSTSPSDASSNSVDCYRVRTCPLPPAIYKHRLTITTSGLAGHQGTLLGLDVVDVPPVTISANDSSLQYSSAFSSPPRFDQWYGFGRSEEIYACISGTPTTLLPYQLTLSTVAVAPVVIPVQFHEGMITITTEGQGHSSDTELHVYDASLHPIPGYANDDTPLALPGGGFQLQSTLQRPFAAGTYYLLLSGYNLADDQLTGADDDYQLGDVLDFPDAVLCSSTTGGLNVSFAISDLAGTQAFPAVLPNSPFEVLWFQFTVGPAWSIAPYCFGDTSSLGCPCGNTGLFGRGCANGANSFGAQLAASGLPSIGVDTFALLGTGMPANGPALYFQGSTQSENFFGNGKQCAAGITTRLGIEFNNGAGSSTYPIGLDLPVSIQGFCLAGRAQTYQIWYRDLPAYCTLSGFNLTNGVLAYWAP